eukprot:2371804-Rhodomonas_salina.1
MPVLPCCEVRLWPGAGCGTRLSGGKSGMQSPSMAWGLTRHQAFRGEAWGAKVLPSQITGRQAPGRLVAVRLYARDPRSTDKCRWP